MEKKGGKSKHQIVMGVSMDREEEEEEALSRDVVLEVILPKVSDGRDLRRCMQVFKQWHDTISSDARFICRTFPPLPPRGSCSNTLGIIVSFVRGHGAKEAIVNLHVYLEKSDEQHQQQQICGRIKEVCNIDVVPPKTSRFYPYIHTSASNGLLRLVTNNFNYVEPFLIHPSTGEYVALPTTTESEHRGYAYGFTFDVKGNAYKVSRILLSGDIGYFPTKVCSLNILTLGEDSDWRHLAVLPYTPRCFEAVAVNDRHIVYKAEDELKKLPVLLAIDAHRETWQEKPYPPSLHNGTFFLRALGGCLAAVFDAGSGRCISCIDIWILTDYDDNNSWSRRYSIPCHSTGVGRMLPLAVWGREVLLIFNVLGEDRLQLYDPVTGMFRRVGVAPFRVGVAPLKSLGHYEVVEYQERLVPFTLKSIVKNKLQVYDGLQRSQPSAIRDVQESYDPEAA